MDHSTVVIDRAREAAWWKALWPLLNEAAYRLSETIGVRVAPRDHALEGITAPKLPDGFGHTGVFARLEGDTRGLLLLGVDLPANRALAAAVPVFKALTYGIGGFAGEPWAVVGTTASLSKALLHEADDLVLAVQATAGFRSLDGSWRAGLCFLPDYSHWHGRWSLVQRYAYDARAA